MSDNAPMYDSGRRESAANGGESEHGKRRWVAESPKRGKAQPRVCERLLISPREHFRTTTTTAMASARHMPPLSIESMQYLQRRVGFRTQSRARVRRHSLPDEVCFRGRICNASDHLGFDTDRLRRSKRQYGPADLALGAPSRG